MISNTRNPRRPTRLQFLASAVSLVQQMHEDVINIRDNTFNPHHDEILEYRERRWRALQSHRRDPLLVPGSLARHGEGRVLSALLLERLLPEARSKIKS
jgi:hypothetical protein